MSAVVVQVLVVVLFALTCGALAAAALRGHLGRAAIALFVGALGTWIGAFVVITADIRNADEFASCDANCAPMHYATAVVFIASPLLIALAGLAMLVSRGSRWRLRRTRGNHG
jgi:hypothetical protein